MGSLPDYRWKTIQMDTCSRLGEGSFYNTE